MNFFRHRLASILALFLFNLTIIAAPSISQELEAADQVADAEHSDIFDYGSRSCALHFGYNDTQHYEYQYQTDEFCNRLNANFGISRGCTIDRVRVGGNWRYRARFVVNRIFTGRGNDWREARGHAWADFVQWFEGRGLHRHNFGYFFRFPTACH